MEAQGDYDLKRAKKKKKRRLLQQIGNPANGVFNLTGNGQNIA